MRAPDGLAGVVDDLDLGAGLRCDRTGGLQNVWGWRVGRRASNGDVHARQRSRLEERAGDVVPSPDEREANSLQRPEVAVEREQVGERLAGVVLVGQRVDYGYGRGRGELHDLFLCERADDDRVAVGGQRVRRVGDRLAPAELELVGSEDDRRHPEAGSGGDERDARPRRRLREVARERVPAQRVDPAVGIARHLSREVEQLRQLLRGDVGNAEEVLRYEADRHVASIGPRTRFCISTSENGCCGYSPMLVLPSGGTLGMCIAS